LLLVFSDINISQGSIATPLRCGGIFYSSIARNLMLSLSVKNILNVGQHLTKV